MRESRRLRGFPMRTGRRDELTGWRRLCATRLVWRLRLVVARRSRQWSFAGLVVVVAGSGAALALLPAVRQSAWWVPVATGVAAAVVLLAQVLAPLLVGLRGSSQGHRWVTSGQSYLATVQELRARTALLYDRGQEVGEIVAFATGTQSYRWLVGGAWAGKTSLLAEVVVAGLPQHQVDVVCYFLQRRAADADSARFLAAVVPQLAGLLGEDPASADVHEFNRLWQQATRRADETGRHLLLVVDGLDEDTRPPGVPSVASYLPVLVGGRAHVLIASRPHAELPTDLPVGHPLVSARPVVLEPFRGHQELAALARQELNDLLSGDDLASDLIGLLAAAAGPLSINDLAALSEDAETGPAHRRLVRRVVERQARSLEPVGPEGERRYQFAHDSLLQHAQSHEDLASESQRQRMDAWAASWRDQGWPEITPRYLLDSYPATLRGEGSRLARLVTDIGWIDLATHAIGVDRVLANLEGAQQDAPHDRRVEGALNVVRGQAHHLRRPWPLTEPGYIMRQLGMHAAELGEESLAGRAAGASASEPALRPRPAMDDPPNQFSPARRAREAQRWARRAGGVERRPDRHQRQRRDAGMGPKRTRR